MKLLITGGAGFIGSHLAECYLDQGHEVFVLDNLATGSPNNVAHLEGNKNFHFIQDSVLNYEIALELVGTCDVIFHLAAAVGVKYIIDNPLKSMEINTRGTEIVLQLCNKFRKKVLITSTSEIYGKNTNLPLCENDDRVLGPTTTHRWSYSCCKAYDEFLAQAYFHSKGLPIIIVRLFNTVGPRQTGQYGMVIPRLVQQALSGEDLSVHGDGKQTRTFGYVKDVVKSIHRLVDEPKAVGEIFNIGGREEISIYELAERIIQLTESKSKINLIPYEQAYKAGFEDMRRRIPDCAKLEKFIDYRPDTSLNEILKQVISYHRSKNA